MVNVHYLVAPGSVAWHMVRVGSGLGGPPAVSSDRGLKRLKDFH